MRERECGEGKLVPYLPSPLLCKEGKGRKVGNRSRIEGMLHGGSSVSHDAQ